MALASDYSNMDRAPILEVDVPTGIDATLQMLNSRMSNVEIERDYQPNLPRIRRQLMPEAN